MAKRGNPPPLTRALVQDNVPALVVDRLWIGSIHAAFNQDSMQDRGITHVLNASGLPATFPRQFTYFTVDVRDKESTNILGAIAAVNIFIEAGLDKGGVLVHCAGGRSRSAAFVVAFIMSTQGCDYDYAYAQVRRARPVASVNRGFEQQLRAYGATQCDVFAAHQLILRVKAAQLLERRIYLQHRASSSSSGSNSSAIAAVCAGARGRSGGTGRGEMQQQQQELPPPTPSIATHQVSNSASSTGMPPTPRSPRERGRSAAGGASPGSGYWQRRGGTSRGRNVSGGSGGGSLTNSGSWSGGSGGGNKARDELQYLPKEPRPPRFRLCRPGSASVQVIPPLKPLDRMYACRGCGSFLFTGGHVIKINIDLPSISSILAHTSPRNMPDHSTSDGPSSPLSSLSTVLTSRAVGVSSPSPASTASYGGGVLGKKDSFGMQSHRCSGGVVGSGDRRSPIQPPPAPAPPPLCEGFIARERLNLGHAAALAARDSGTVDAGLKGPGGEWKLEKPPIHKRFLRDGDEDGHDSGSKVGLASVGAVGALHQPRGGFAEDGCGLGEGGREARMKPLLPGSTPPARNHLRAGVAARRKPVFGFESEDESSTVDPSEESECTRVPDGGGGCPSGNCGGSSFSGALGGIGRCAGRHGAFTPPRLARPDFHMLLQSRMSHGTSVGSVGGGGNSSIASTFESASPDRMTAPRSPSTPASCGSSSPCTSETSASGRPLSAEKRQFLMKMQLIEEHLANAATTPVPPTLSSMVTDSDMMASSNAKAGRYLYVDFLDWMGDIMSAAQGRVCCPNPSCRVELGSWSWERPEPVRAPTGPPVIMLDKTLVKSTSYMLSHIDGRNGVSRDNTPRSSPTSNSVGGTKPLSPPDPSVDGVVNSGRGGAGSGDRNGGAMPERPSGILESKPTGRGHQRFRESESPSPPTC